MTNTQKEKAVHRGCKGYGRKKKTFVPDDVLTAAIPLTFDFFLTVETTNWKYVDIHLS